MTEKWLLMTSLEIAGQGVSRGEPSSDIVKGTFIQLLFNSYLCTKNQKMIINDEPECYWTRRQLRIAIFRCYQKQTSPTSS